MEERLPRKLAVIFYADVAGYSRLTGADEDATHRKLGEYLDFIAESIGCHHGQINHYAGDAVLARFDAVVDAVTAATAIQQHLGEQNCNLDEDRQLQFRIGINIGDVIEDRGDIYGDGVNIAARLESLADAGGICVSESVRTALGSKLDLGFDDLGAQQVKNITEPVKVYRITAEGIDCSNRSAPDVNYPSSEKPSLAVFPFQNLSSDDDNRFFAEGISEEIMTSLSRYGEIEVAAKGSSELVSEQKLDPGAAARKLNVQYTLSGSVRRAGDRVRITASLTEGESGLQAWSEQYDHVLEDIFTVQDEVAQKIVSMLVGKIEKLDQERSLRKDTENLNAYECVLRGRYYFGDWKGPKDDVQRARDLFEKAIELDPRYAAAYAGLAATHHQDRKNGWSNDPDTSTKKCIEMAKKAIDLDENESYAHLVLSSAYFRFKGDFDLARRQFEIAVEKNPNYYWNYCYGCWFSACDGNLETSISCAHEALRRNPLLPDGCLGSLGIAEYLSGEYERAISTLCQMTNLDPETYACLAASYGQLGRDEDAKKIGLECVNPDGDCARSVNKWREFWGGIASFREPEPLEHLIDGLDKAGLVIK